MLIPTSLAFSWFNCQEQVRNLYKDPLQITYSSPIISAVHWAKLRHTPRRLTANKKIIKQEIYLRKMS